MNLYVVLIDSSTNIGNLVTLATRYNYNHVAISLDEKLTKMYSFARYKDKLALVGGFVNEKPSRYMHGIPKIRVFKLEVEKEKYKEIENTINNIIEHKNEYIYNTYSALLFPFHLNVNIKNAYTCFGFSNFILNKLDYNFKSIKDIDLKLSDKLIFEGSLDEYTDIQKEKDEYFEYYSKPEIILETAKHFKKLTKKLIVRK